MFFSHFSNELDVTIRTLKEQFEPYSRFVRIQTDELKKIQNKFEQSSKELQQIRQEIQKFLK